MSSLHVLRGIALFLFSTIAAADVTITGTRIIFPSTAKSISVQLNNNSDQAALIQTWIDDGNSAEIPESHRTPFVLTPSLTRLEPKKGQKIRLISKGIPVLPQAHESLFWFNMLDIPPSAQEDHDENKLKISVRTRIKIFYRPQNLKVSLNDALKSLTFKDVADQKYTEISNTSPYYITLNKLVYSAAGIQKNYKTSLMIAPFSSEKIAQSELDLKQNKQIEYEVINDSGGYEKFSTIVK